MHRVLVFVLLVSTAHADDIGSQGMPRHHSHVAVGIGFSNDSHDTVEGIWRNFSLGVRIRGNDWITATYQQPEDASVNGGYGVDEQDLWSASAMFSRMWCMDRSVWCGAGGGGVGYERGRFELGDGLVYPMNWSENWSGVFGEARGTLRWNFGGYAWVDFYAGLRTYVHTGNSGDRTSLGAAIGVALHVTP